MTESVNSRTQRQVRIIGHNVILLNKKHVDLHALVATCKESVHTSILFWFL